jgi:hypothetical protein
MYQGFRYHHHFLEQVEPAVDVWKSTPCHSKLRNCALCGFDGPQEAGGTLRCKICIDTFILNNVTYPDGTTREECVFDECPSETRKVMNFNGIAYCEPCRVGHCSECAMARGRVKATNVEEEEVQEGMVEREICLKCEGAYILNEMKDKCTSALQWKTERAALGEIPKISLS